MLEVETDDADTSLRLTLAQQSHTQQVESGHQLDHLLKYDKS